MSKQKKDEKEDYHGIAPIKTIIKKMKKEYDKDPKNWNILSSRDNHGNVDTIINKKPNSYWLKSKKLSPYSALSMGSVVRDINKDIDEETGKKLDRNDMLRLFGMVVPIKKDKNIVASGIENYSQKKGDKLKKIIKEKKPNLAYQMARKLDEEFTKQYPERKNMYS
jgi:hypothetical protein